MTSKTEIAQTGADLIENSPAELILRKSTDSESTGVTNTVHGGADVQDPVHLTTDDLRELLTYVARNSPLHAKVEAAITQTRPRYNRKDRMAVAHALDGLKNLLFDANALDSDALALHSSGGDALLRIAQQCPAVVPDGWKSTPREPTPEMFKACDTVIQGYGAKLVWMRMYDAAPAPGKGGEA